MFQDFSLTNEILQLLAMSIAQQPDTNQGLPSGSHHTAELVGDSMVRATLIPTSHNSCFQDMVLCGGVLG